jgi:hypothetical protein
MARLPRSQREEVVKYFNGIGSFFERTTRLIFGKPKSRIALYLAKYEKPSHRPLKNFRGVEVRRLELAYSVGDAHVSAPIEEFEPASGIIVEIELPDGSPRAGQLFLNSDVALDIAHAGIGPVDGISASVSIMFGGLHFSGRPIRVKAIQPSESTSLTPRPVEISLVDGQQRQTRPDQKAKGAQ